MLTSLPAGNMYVLWRWLDGDHFYAGNLSWDLVGILLWYEGQDFVGDLVSKMPCPAGKSADISWGFVSF